MRLLPLMFPVLFVLVVPISVAQAQDNARLKRSKIKSSQDAFNRGVEAYNRKDFSVAATLFLRAHAIVPESMFLYNAAKATRNAGNLDAALSYAKRAQADKERPLPKGTQAQVRELIASISKQIEAENASRMQISYVGWTGVGVLSAGAVVWGLSSLGGAGLTSDLAELANERDKGTYDQKRADIESRQSFLQVTYPTGIALVVLGTGLLAWDLATKGAEPWSVSLMPLPQGGAHATFSLEF